MAARDPWDGSRGPPPQLHLIQGPNLSKEWGPPHKAKQKAKQSGAAKARNDSLPETTNPGIADRNESRRLDANTQTDGVGFEPTRRFHVCRFSRSAKGCPGLPTRTPLETRDETALSPSPTGRPRPSTKTRNRAKPRHNTPNRDHSPDKSATSRGWHVSK